MSAEKCFACGRKLGKNPRKADTRDGQIVYVGIECAKLIDAAGDAGWQPPQGAPRLYPLRETAPSWEQPDYTKYPVATLRSGFEICKLCGKEITPGNQYHDGGDDRQAHVKCARDKKNR